MVDRVLIGTRGSDKGVYVSKPSVNVTASTDQMMFDSDALQAYIVSHRGQGRLDPGATHTITHSLGYKPKVNVVWTMDSEMSNWMTGITQPTFSYTWQYLSGDQYYRLSAISVTSGGSGFKPSVSNLKGYYQNNTVTDNTIGSRNWGARVTCTTNSSGVITGATINDSAVYDSSSPTGRIKIIMPAEDMCDTTDPGHATVTHPSVNTDKIGWANNSFTGCMRYIEDYESCDYGEDCDIREFEVSEGVTHAVSTSTLTISNKHEAAEGKDVDRDVYEVDYISRAPSIYYSYVIFKSEDIE